MKPHKVNISFFCHAGLDPASGHFNRFWIPAFAGMTNIGLFATPSKKNVLSVRLSSRIKYKKQVSLSILA
jgi:hypothetical protein